MVIWLTFSSKFDIIMDRVYQIVEANSLIFIIKNSKYAVKVTFCKI